MRILSVLKGDVHHSFLEVYINIIANREDQMEY